MGAKRKRHFAQRSNEEEIQSSKKPKAMTVSISGTSEDSQTSALQAQLMAELEQANAMLAKRKSIIDAEKSKTKPSARAIKMDNAGNLIDEQGNIIETSGGKPLPVTHGRAPSKNHEKEKKLDQKEEENMKLKKEAETNPYLAHLASSTGRKGKRGNRVAGQVRQSSRALKFFIPGEYAKSTAALSSSVDSVTGNGQSKSDVSRKQERTDTSNKSKSSLGLVPRSTMTQRNDSRTTGATIDKPNLKIEWWDGQFLPKERRGLGRIKGDYVGDEADLQLSNCATYKYVEHPAPIPSLNHLKAAQTLPMYLTKQERARIRKKRRAEAEQERRDQEAMGLVPPREPKLKLSNFMRVLGEKAILDPSKMEMSVLKQIYHRKATHELNNAKNKLTDEQRKEKTWLKRQNRESKATSESLHVAVFCVGQLDDVNTQIKIRKSAQEWFLTGALVRCLETDERTGLSKNFVLVEGGPRGIEKFSRLMLERINWARVAAASSSSSSSASTGEKGNACRDTDASSGQGGNDDSSGENGAMAADIGSDLEHQSEANYDSEGEKSWGTAGNPANTCISLWKGLASKRVFSRFLTQEAKSPAAVRHWFDSNHLIHFWHLALEEAL